MKGFFGALLVFILWTGVSIYYLSLKQGIAVRIATDATAMPRATKKNDLNKEATPEDTSNRFKENPVAVSATETGTKDITNSDKSATSAKRSVELIDAQILADEIKKTIAISDTIDIDRDEPEQSLDNTIEVTTGPSVSTEIFYPKYNNTDLVLDKRLVEYATELKALLNENPNKKITIIGHTDNVGNGIDNFQIALRKARQVKWYLTTSRGIPRQKVTAISRGEEEPIESNNNKWGRNKNNRIEVIID